MNKIQRREPYFLLLQTNVNFGGGGACIFIFVFYLPLIAFEIKFKNN